jgi:UDP-glucuronate decarboxylase
MLDSGLVGPVNLGNPEEHSVLELAQMVIAITRSSSKIAYKELPADDPTRRCPDISVATRDLSWQPTVELSGGLVRTTDWLRGELGSKAI